MEFTRVSVQNGHWVSLLNQWEESCTEFDESFSDYATGSLPILRPLAEQAQLNSSGVFALKDDSGYHGICQLNSAHIKGYTDKVLRVRHIVHAPRYDFGSEVVLDDYAKLLSGIFKGVIAVSDTEMRSPDVKFHFRSPAERQFFVEFNTTLEGHKVFDKVNMVGSWLYIKK
jgi:hypothetical protein